MILKIFLWGVAITVPVFFIQIGLKSLLDTIKIDPLAYSIIYWFLIIALSEEFFKYLVIKMRVINSADMDEPLDIMLYMVISSLGFAALENVLYLFTPAGDLSLNTNIKRVLIITIIRFFGANFLHTLCSAVAGYFMALSFCKVRKGILTIPFGLILATLLHGFYDFSIITLNGYPRIIIPVIILITLAGLVFSGFTKLKKLKSVCIIKN